MDFQWSELARGGWTQHTCHMVENKILTQLLRAHSSVALKRGNTAITWGSSCGAPVSWPIINRTQERDLLYALIARDYRQTMAAILTGHSTCRGYKDAIEYTAARFGRKSRTIQKAIAATLSSE